MAVPPTASGVTLDDAEIDQTFQLGCERRHGRTREHLGIPTQVNDANRDDRYRTFRLRQGGQTERCYFTYCRRFGAS